MLYYNYLFSIPVLLTLAYFTGEKTAIGLHFKFEVMDVREFGSMFLLSTLLGFTLNTSDFVLNKLMSATSIMVAGNTIKFCIILFSDIWLKPALNLIIPINSTLFVFWGWLYSQTGKVFSKYAFISSVILVVLLCGANNYISRHNQINSMNQILNNEIYKSYIPKLRSVPYSDVFTPGIVINNITEFRLPDNCVNQNASIWKVCDAVRCTPYNQTQNWNYPRVTDTGEKTGEFINRVLKVAWGSNPPSIDLYLRTGCNGIMEMKYLFESIELFWPRFLGSVVIVLDAGDETILNYLLPRNPSHRYVVAFEHLPCLPARVFNQYSYLNLDRYCTADYVVTIDSDCIFHSPVTPDMIFRQGKVILIYSRIFQGDTWRPSVDAVLGKGLYDGHYMVTQPVTFALSTFSSFRKWFYKSTGLCYEDRLATIAPLHYTWFCWMCQLGTYLQNRNLSKSNDEQYWFHNFDNPELEPIIRYAVHVTYEAKGQIICNQQSCYENNTNEIFTEGLCRAFGTSVFKICSNYSDFTFVNEVTFLYAHNEIQAASALNKKNALKNYLRRLLQATAMATGIVINES